MHDVVINFITISLIVSALSSIQFAPKLQFHLSVCHDDGGNPSTRHGRHLGLKPGDPIKFFIHPDGSVVLLPKFSRSAL